MTVDYKPEGAHTVTPHLVVRGADEAAAWYVQVLGAEERDRLEVPGGKLMRVELAVGDSRVVLADEFREFDVLSPLSVGGTATVLHVYFEDVESVWQRAVEAGAEVRQPLGDAFWGEKYGQITDPFGHRWGLAQRVRDVPPDEIARAAAALFGGGTGTSDDQIG
jgi:PhnB protein